MLNETKHHILKKKLCKWFGIKQKQYKINIQIIFSIETSFEKDFYLFILRDSNHEQLKTAIHKNNYPIQYYIFLESCEKQLQKNEHVNWLIIKHFYLNCTYFTSLNRVTFTTLRKFLRPDNPLTITNTEVLLPDALTFHCTALLYNHRHTIGE